MSYELSKKVRNLTPYTPLQGEYSLRLDANESYFTIPEDIMANCFEAIKEISFNRYPDPYATKLCEAFSEYYGVPKNLLTAGNGSDELIGVIVGALLQKGEKILTLTPDFSMYRFYGEIYENPVLELKKDDDFNIDVDAVIKTVKDEDIKLLIFSNPCNPTSVGLTADKTVKLIENVDCLVVLDEAYMDFWNQSLLSKVTDYDNLIILKTCSKAIGMASVRVGFAVANQVITKALRAVKSPYNVNSVSQAIATAVLKEKDFLKNCEKEIILSAKYLKMEIENMGFQKVYDSVTNFVFVKTDKAKEIYEKLLGEGIAVRCFGEYLRITADSIENNKILIEKLKDITKGMVL